MRYIVVNDRKPKGLPRYCGCCLTKIEDKYCRELRDRILYCDALCFETHLFETNVASGALDAPVKFTSYEKGGLR